MPSRLRSASSLTTCVVVFGPMAEFVGGARHTAGDDLVAILGPGMQPAPELFDRGRENEDADDVVTGVLHQLLSALPVDVEQHVAARRERGLDLCLGCSVVVAEDHRMLEKRVREDHLGKPRLIDEHVVTAIDLARPRRPRGDRDRHLEIVLALEEPARERRLAGARGRGQDQHQAAPGDVDRHRRTTRCFAAARADDRPPP